MKKTDEIELYTPIEEANQEIRRRWSNSELRKKVEAYVGAIPTFLLHEPKAYLARFITTPNFELFKFLKLAEQVNLPALSAEYTNDYFVSKNCDKRVLGKLPIFKKSNHKGNPIFTNKTTVDFSLYEGKPFSDVRTLWNEPLIDFHHRLLRAKSIDLEIVDASSWLRVNGDRAEEYYCHYLALFICHAVLFENFITNEEEERFSKNVVFPAFKQVVNHFGMKPLIVPLVPHDQAADIYWRCYPAELEAEVLKHLSKAEDSSGQHHAERCTGKNSDYCGIKENAK